MGIGSCTTIIKQQQTALDWNFAMATPATLLFNSTCNTVGPDLKFLLSGCLTTEINVFSVGDRQVLSECVRLKKSNRKICIIISLTNLAFTLGQEAICGKHSFKYLNCGGTKVQALQIEGDELILLGRSSGFWDIRLCWWQIDFFRL